MTDKMEGPATVARIFGEASWLLSVSPRHCDLRLLDLNWLVMPPILLKQFHLFWEGRRPIGIAFWALLDGPREANLLAALNKPGLVVKLQAEDWKSGDRLWLIDLVSPFATSENRHAELMLGDLITGPLCGQSFKMIASNPESGVRSVVDIGRNARDELVAFTRERLGVADASR